MQHENMKIVNRFTVRWSSISGRLGDGRAAGADAATRRRPQPPAAAARRAAASSRVSAAAGQGPMDEDRARQLYVSNDHADHGRGVDFAPAGSAEGGRRQEVRGSRQRGRRFQEGHVSQQRRGPRRSGLRVSAAEQARRERARRADLGARRRSRQLGHHDVALRSRGGRARIRGDLSRVPRQHRIWREALQRDRLRRLRDRRCDVGQRLLEDDGSRRPRSGRHHGLEPRRLHHALLRVPRPDSLQGGRGDRSGHEPDSPAVVLRSRLPAKLCDAEADRRVAVREARALHPAVAAVSRRQAAHTAARACRDQRRGRLVLRGSADRRCAAIAQTGPRRNQGLCRSADLGLEWRSCLQPPRGPEDARARATPPSRSTPGTAPGRSSTGTCVRTSTPRNRRPPPVRTARSRSGRSLRCSQCVPHAFALLAQATPAAPAQDVS